MDNLYERCNYRIKKSSEDYASAERLFKEEFFNAALNRAYYSVFHLMNTLLLLDGFNFKSHSAVIAKFRERYVKTKIFDRNISAIISELYEYRNDSDYTDLFEGSQEETKMQVSNAKIFIEEVKPYIEKRIAQI